MQSEVDEIMVLTDAVRVIPFKQTWRTKRYMAFTESAIYEVTRRRTWKEVFAYVFVRVVRKMDEKGD